MISRRTTQLQSLTGDLAVPSANDCVERIRRMEVRAGWNAGPGRLVTSRNERSDHPDERPLTTADSECVQRRPYVIVSRSQRLKPIHRSPADRVDRLKSLTILIEWTYCRQSL